MVNPAPIPKVAPSIPPISSLALRAGRWYVACRRKFARRIAVGAASGWKVERMRIPSLSLMLMLLPLAVGCKSHPTAATKSPPSGVPPEMAEMAKKRQETLAEIKKRGGVLQVDSDDPAKPVLVADLHGFHNVAATLDTLGPLTRLRDLNLYDTSVTDADLQRLRGLPELQTLNLSATKITDAGLATLLTLPNLHALFLNQTKITDAGLQTLRSMPGLTDLAVYDTKVTDEGVAQLRNFPTLHKLTLGGGSITDRGVKQLTALRQLKELTILSSRVSNSTLEELKLASAQLRIVK